MNKVLSLIVLSLCLTNVSQAIAQNEKTSFGKAPLNLGKAFYQVFYQYDSTDTLTAYPRSIDQDAVCVLLIGPEVSQYQLYGGFRGDSVKQAYVGKSISFPEAMGMAKTLGLRSNEFYILRNHLKGDSLQVKNTVTTLTTDYTVYNCVYETAAPSIEWQISDEKKDIGGIEVTKATGRLHGRDWTAWFAESIPYPEGPWELAGLPGLILEAYDAEDTHEFTLMQARPVDLPILQSDTKYEKTTREEFRKYRNQVADAKYSEWKTDSNIYPPFMNFIDKE